MGIRLIGVALSGRMLSVRILFWMKRGDVSIDEEEQQRVQRIDLGGDSCEM